MDGQGQSPATELFDVFLCHNSHDKSEVEEIGRQLRLMKLNPWLDKWHLPPGRDWMELIEEQIKTVRSVAVFVGDDGPGPWQDREVKAFLRRHARSELPVIPIILPSCLIKAPAQPELPPFLESFTWVDFRGDRIEALSRLVWGITGQQQDATKKPTVLIAPALARRERKKLIDYCQNAGLRVLGDGLYPDSADDLRAALLADLKQSNLFVQVLCEDADRSTAFPDGRERWFVNAAKKSLTPTRVLLWRPPEVDPDEADKPEHRAFITGADVLPDKPSTFHERVVEQTRQAFELGPPPVTGKDKRLAMVKFSEDDSLPTTELMETLKADNVLCVASQNGIPIVDVYREFPALDAVIVVLGNCKPAWKEKRGLELVAIALRDDAPLRFYYHPDGKRGLPPLSDPGAIELDGRSQINRLLEGIRSRPRANVTRGDA